MYFLSSCIASGPKSLCTSERQHPQQVGTEGKKRCLEKVNVFLLEWKEMEKQLSLEKSTTSEATEVVSRT